MGEFELLQMAPHTAAKHSLLKLYLDRWFPILGKYHERINYIDGFAGPGKYRDGEDGSPIIAVESAMAHVAKGTLSSSVTINFVFIESKLEHAKHLRCQLEKLEVPASFNISVLDGEFSGQVGSILDKLEEEKKTLAPTFVFVDPFGFSGIPFELMARILKFQKCEVFVNVMVDFINRFLEHPNDSTVGHFPTTFGTEEVLEIPNRQGNRAKQILDLYRTQLKKHAQFVGQFDMYGKKDRKTYSLFFASNATKGFEKMKEAMWSVDKVSGSKFSDADAFASQSYLFEAMGIESLWDDMTARFDGQSVTMTEVDKFVVEKTDYLPSHARKLLKMHEAQADISVIPVTGYKRRAGTYKAGKVEIRFSNDSE